MTDIQPPAPASSPLPEVNPTPTPAPKSVNVIGIVALVAAILGFIFAVIPGAFILGWLLLPVAFVLSIVGLVLKDKKKGLALAGLIISVVGTIAGVIAFTTVVATSFNDSFGGTDSTITAPSDEPESDDAAAEPEAGSRENPAALGSTITGDEYTVVINSVTLNADEAVAGANMFNEPAPAGFSYAIVNATITYTGDESGFASFVGIDYVASTGEVITSADNLAVPPDPALGFDEMYNGGSASGNLVLALPVGDAGVLRVRPGMIADDVFVAIQ